MEQRIEKRDKTFPKHSDLMNEINNMSIAIKLHYTIDASKEDPEKLAKAKESVEKPTWKSMTEFLQKIHRELDGDRYNPIKY